METSAHFHRFQANMILGLGSPLIKKQTKKIMAYVPGACAALTRHMHISLHPFFFPFFFIHNFK